MYALLFAGLFMMNTVMLREHNRVCDVLVEEHPEWEDEQLFQTAKNIIAGGCNWNMHWTCLWKTQSTQMCRLWVCEFHIWAQGTDVTHL